MTTPEISKVIKLIMVNSLLVSMSSGIIGSFALINGTSASVAGFAVTPSSLMWIVGSFLIGGMLGRWGIKKTYDYMLIVLVGADLALIFVPIYTSFWVFCLIAAFNSCKKTIKANKKMTKQVVPFKSKVESSLVFVSFKKKTTSKKAKIPSKFVRKF